MIRYDIHWLQLGFNPVAAVGRFVQKWERDSYIQMEKQYIKQYGNRENTKYKTKIQNKKKNIKK